MNKTQKGNANTRKTIALVLALICIFTLAACGKSAEVKTVEGLIAETKQKLNPDEGKLSEIYSLYNALPEKDKELVEDKEYIASIERYFIVESALEEANSFIEGKNFEDAITAIDNVRTIANAAQNEEIEAILNTIYYESTSFIRLENFITFDEEGNAIPWEDDRVFAFSHDETKAADGEVHVYGFFRSNNSFTELPAYKFELYLPEAYNSEFENISWTGGAPGVDGKGLVYYDEEGNRMYMIESVDSWSWTYTVYIQHAEYAD